jgi:hypothetical protein
MLRSISTAILILAGGALAALLVSLLALRLVLSAAFALSGIRRRAAREQVLTW